MIPISTNKSTVGDCYQGWLNAPLSLTATLMCRVGRYSISWIAPLYLHPYLIILRVKQGDIKYHFWVFGTTRPGIEHQSPGPLANSLFIRLNFFFFWYFHVYIPSDFFSLCVCVCVCVCVCYFCFCVCMWKYTVIHLHIC